MKVLLFVTTILALSGCNSLRGGSDALVLPDKAFPSHIPPHIDYQGERYTLRQWNGQSGEYYRDSEQGYQWQKLITLNLSEGTSLEDFAQAMQMQLQRENTLHALKRQADSLDIRVLYPPQPQHPHFSGYESNSMRYQSSACGISGLQYAEQHAADGDAQQLFAALQAEQADFQRQAAEILASIPCPKK